MGKKNNWQQAVKKTTLQAQKRHHQRKKQKLAQPEPSGLLTSASLPSSLLPEKRSAERRSDGREVIDLTGLNGSIPPLKEGDMKSGNEKRTLDDIRELSSDELLKLFQPPGIAMNNNAVPPTVCNLPTIYNDKGEVIHLSDKENKRLYAAYKSLYAKFPRTTESELDALTKAGLSFRDVAEYKPGKKGTSTLPGDTEKMLQGLHSRTQITVIARKSRWKKRVKEILLDVQMRCLTGQQQELAEQPEALSSVTSPGRPSGQLSRKRKVGSESDSVAGSPQKRQCNDENSLLLSVSLDLLRSRS